MGRGQIALCGHSTPDKTHKEQFCFVGAPALPANPHEIIVSTLACFPARAPCQCPLVAVDTLHIVPECGMHTPVSMISPIATCQPMFSITFGACIFWPHVAALMALLADFQWRRMAAAGSASFHCPRSRPCSLASMAQPLHGASEVREIRIVSWRPTAGNTSTSMPTCTCTPSHSV